MTLADFRPGADPTVVKRGPRRPVKAPWIPPRPEDLGIGRILAFDQSLSATGFVAISNDGQGGVRVDDAQTLRGRAAGETGRNKDLGEFTDLFLQIQVLLVPYATDPGWPSWEVVHETPPLGGGGMRNTDSSLLAAAAVRAALRSLSMPLLPSIAPVTHRKRIAGDTTFRKPDEGQIGAAESKRRYHLALAETAAGLGVDMARVTNEGQRDALAVGLTELLGRLA